MCNSSRFLGGAGALALAVACSQSSTTTGNGGNGGGSSSSHHGGGKGGSSSGGSKGSMDAGSDPAIDAGVDAGVDAGIDAGVAGIDAGADAGEADGDAGSGGWNPDAGWPPPPGIEVCPPGSVQFIGQTKTFGPCVQGSSSYYGPVDYAQVVTLEPWGATTSSDGGAFSLCAPNGVPFTVEVLADGYAPAYLAELALGQNQQSFGHPIYLLCDALVGIFEAETSGWNFSTEGSVLVSIISLSQAAPCDPGGDGLNGWHVTATLPDGGALAGAEVGYLDSTGEVHESATSTFDDGYAFVANIDPSIDMIQIEIDGGPPGVSCPTSNGAVGFDGLVHVQPASFGDFPYFIP